MLDRSLELTEKKLLDVIESSYPNPVTVPELSAYVFTILRVNYILETIRRAFVRNLQKSQFCDWIWWYFRISFKISEIKVFSIRKSELFKKLKFLFRTFLEVFSVLILYFDSPHPLLLNKQIIQTIQKKKPLELFNRKNYEFFEKFFVNMKNKTKMKYLNEAIFYPI